MNEKARKLREEKVLEIVVQSYITKAIPISSRYVSRRLGLSSATIRNIMADLEDRSLIGHPHTSAGRIPTDRGYRYYVDSLMHLKSITKKEIKEIKSEYQSKVKSLDDILERTAHILSISTNYAGITLIPKTEEAEKRVRDYLISRLREERNLSYKLVKDAYEIMKTILMEGLKRKLYLEGASHILSYPEFRDQRKSADILRFFEEKDKISGALSGDLKENTLKIRIGSENRQFGLEEFSVVTSGFKIGNQTVGRLGVIGPTRMNYDKVIPVVKFLAHTVTNILSY